MLRAFFVSLTGAASRWLRNQPSGSITTWEDLKPKFMNKYCPLARTAKKMEEINNFQQEPDESLFRTWERFKELLMKCPQHYLIDIQEVILFYNGLDVLTRQILDSKGTRSTKTSDGLAAIQAQLNNLGREIKKINDTLLSLEESLTKFMVESAKRHEENSNIIKEIQASTDAAIGNQGASIKTLEIQIRQMSKVLQERGFGSLPSSTETNPQDQVKSISTAKANFFGIYHIRCGQYAEAQDVKILDAYDHTLPRKEKDLGSFTLPCFIYNVYFDKALIDLKASVSVMPFSTYTNLGLRILSHTRLTIELVDRTIKQPRGIAENVLVRIGKFIFPIDFIILDIPKDDDVLLIPGRPFLSTAHSKIDVFKRKITLRFIGEGDESFNLTYGNYIELNDLDTPLETKTYRDVDFEPTFVKTNSYKMKFSCVIGYKYVNAALIPSLSINLISKSFYYSIIKDKDEGMSHAKTLIDIHVFVGSFSIIIGFTIIDDDDTTKVVVLGMKFCKKYASCQRIMKKFSLED
ncbi:ribonuclease H-like domain-containing protein [Tanacetum coccineum]